MDDVETPIERPDVIVPDTGPLIHLAQTDALHLLHQIGGRVVVADMVAFEATQDMTKPGAQEIQDWLDAGQRPDSNAPVLVASTEIGRLFAKARTVDPTTRAKDSGELAIMQWLGSYVDYHSDASILIVYENGKIPRFAPPPSPRFDCIAWRRYRRLDDRRLLLPARRQDDVLRHRRPPARFPRRWRRDRP